MLQWIEKINYQKQRTASAVFLLLAVFCFFGVLLFVKPVFAVDGSTPVPVNTTSELQQGVDVIQQPLGLPSTDIRIIVANIIRVALGLLGFILLLIILYGGYLYMTSGGNEEQIGKAKSIFKNAIIGLAIILSAYSIVWFVMRMLGVKGGPSSGQGVSLSGYQNFKGSGSLGKIIKDHYPERDQTNVARNTKIIVSFRKPIAVDANVVGKNTIIEDVSNNGAPDGIFGNCDLTKKDSPDFWEKYCDHIRLSDDYINISVVTGTEENAFTQAAILAPTSTDINGVTGVFNIVIVPLHYLGSSQENVKYQVRLGKNVFLDDSANDYPSAFTNTGGYYAWQFTCGTNLDLNPPFVKNVWPKNLTASPRNTVIQVDFSEAVDPTGVQGAFVPTSEGGVNYFKFQNGFVYLQNEQNLQPVGNFTLTNGYRTMEFTPSDPCGVNACGGKIYCLPVNGEANIYNLLLKSAEVYNINSWSSIPFSGVADVAGNALDGNNNNKIDIATTTLPVFENWKEYDNYFWKFTVENKIDSESPYLKQVHPGLDAENIEADQDLDYLFSKRMRVEPLNDITIEENPDPTVAFNGKDKYGHDGQCKLWVNQMNELGINVKASDCVIEPIDYWMRREVNDDGTTFVKINHGPFLINLRQFYYPVATSTVEDVNFNCFYPGVGPGDNDRVNSDDIIDKYSASAWTSQGALPPSQKRESLVCDKVFSPENCTGATTTPEISYGCDGLVSNMVSTTKSCLQELVNDSIGAGMVK